MYSRHSRVNITSVVISEHKIEHYIGRLNAVRISVYRSCGEKQNQSIRPLQGCSNNLEVNTTFIDVRRQ